MVLMRTALGPELDWLPDDTEESLVGTSVHQTVIADADSVANRYKRRAGLPWFIGNQLKLIIPRVGKRRPYYPSPDLIIHPTLGEVRLTSLSIADYGPPALAVEVASLATAREHDLNTLNPDAKPRAYDQAGIDEYLFYDPLEEFVPGRIRAWRRGAAGVYEDWLPDPTTGRWHSRLGISFAPEPGGILLRIYDPDGVVIPTDAELEQMLEDERAQLTAERARVAALEAELRRRGGR